MNGAGGADFTSVARALAPGATLATYGGAFKRPIALSLTTLISRGITLTGFSLERHLAGMGKAARDAAVNAAIADARGDGGAPIKLLLARETMADFLPHALVRASKPAAAERTVVVVMPQ